MNSVSMDNLPEPLFLEILSHLDDLADVSRCLVSSKTFKTAYPDLRSINHQCTLKRYLNSRPSTVSSSSKVTTPFKTVFVNMISKLRVVETVRIGIDDELLDLSYRKREGEEDQGDDLYLTDGEFVKVWLPRVSGGMKLLSISDFWLQSCRRRSDVLSLVSSYCHNLVDLEVKNAWLSADNVSPMPMLTSLTLESVKLDDKRLVRLNECFPNLKVLNLINVWGVKAPCVNLLNLKTCHWIVPDHSLSSLTLIAPNLSTLILVCIKSTRLRVEAPKLFHVHLDIERRSFEIKKFENLKTVWLKSGNIGALFDTFGLAETVENLTVDTRDWPKGATGSCNFTMKRVFTVFPNLKSLCIKSNVWSGFEACYKPLDWLTWDGRKALKTFSAYLLLGHPSMTLSCVSGLLDGCKGVSEVSLLIHGDVDSTVSKSFISRCMSCCRPGLNWKWGIWGEGMGDTWITDLDGFFDETLQIT